MDRFPRAAVDEPKSDRLLVSFNESSSAFRRPLRWLAALRLLAIGLAITRRRALPATAMARRKPRRTSVKGH